MTDNHIDSTYTKIREKLDGVGGEEKKTKVGSKDYYSTHPTITENLKRVKAMKDQGSRSR
ncbi:MAG: hypothetical protein LUQ32_08900 [Methanomicrobiales archaeon]|nr:hypothetical protein [Methanomicrobiales archaeon]